MKLVKENHIKKIFIITLSVQMQVATEQVTRISAIILRFVFFLSVNLGKIRYNDFKYAASTYFYVGIVKKSNLEINEVVDYFSNLYCN